METLHGEIACDVDCFNESAAVTEDLPNQMMSLPLRLGGKINDSSGWDRLWVQLERKGWRTEFGPKGDDGPCTGCVTIAQTGSNK